jgi:RHS repeat-associated protein
VDYIKIQSDAAFTDSYDPADFYEYGDRDTAFTDTDGDGLSDADEVAAGSNPALADSDGDGIGDYEEINYYHSNPNLADTDGDGISDYLELTYYHTSLLLTDTNGDGRADGVPDYDYGYDLNGNRISKVTVSATHNYVYDRENRLITVTDGSASTLFEAVYDYRTRRMSKVEDGSTKYFVYDGGTNVQELDGTRTLTKQLVRGTGMGGGIGSVLYNEDVAGSNPEYFVYNAIGSTVALTDSTGVITDTKLYEAFGGVVQSTGTSSENRGFCTKEKDSSIDLVNFGFRYFDENLGRFTTRDPAGYPDGPNNYLYCHNNPINFIDPLGLEENKYKNMYTESEWNDRPHGCPPPEKRPIIISDDTITAVSQLMPKPKEVYSSFGDTTLELGLPGYGDVKDIKVLADPNETDLNKNIAAGSLFLGYSVLPNVGPLIRKMMKAFKKGTNQGIDATKIITKNMDEVIEGGTDLTKNGSKLDTTMDVKKLKNEGLSEADKVRIQKFADKNNTEVNVVGSRANNTAGSNSDYDYIIGKDGSNSKLRKKARKELPQGKAGGEIDARTGKETGIDVFNTKLDKSKPHKTFKPKEIEE